MASKRDWNQERENKVKELVATIKDAEMVSALMARGLSDWIQNKVQSLKLESVDDKMDFLDSLKVDDIGTATRENHDSLNTTILEMVANGTATIKNATKALSGTIADKKAFIATTK